MVLDVIVLQIQIYVLKMFIQMQLLGHASYVIQLAKNVLVQMQMIVLHAITRYSMINTPLPV